MASKSSTGTRKTTPLHRSDPPQGITPADEPGSFVVGPDGVRRPNPYDQAMRERERIKAETAPPLKIAELTKEEADVS